MEMKAIRSASIGYYGGLAGCAVLWGMNYGVIRMAFDSLEPLTLLLLRYLLAVPLFFILLKRREGGTGLPVRDWGMAALTGGIAVTALELCTIYSISYTSLANASLLTVTAWPIFTAIFSVWLTKEKITSALAGGGTLALIGVILVIAGGGQGLELKDGYMLGNLLALAGGLTGAIGSVLCVRLASRHSMLRITSWYSLFGLALLVPIAVVFSEDPQWGGMGARAWSAVLYNAIPCTVLAIPYWNYAMLKVGATRASFFRYLTPCAAAAAGLWFFAEELAPVQLAGSAALLAGLTWIVTERKRKES